MSANLELMSMYIEKDLHEEVRLKCGETGKSLFIRNAIKSALGLVDESSNELTNMAKQVEALDTKSIEQKISGMEIKLQLIYEEIQRQNEILIMTHRRSTFAANFSLHVLNKLLGSADFTDEETRELTKLVEIEIKKNGLQILRK